MAVLTAATWVSLTGNAHAAFILYTNRAAFNAAAGSLTTETFNSIFTDTIFTNSTLAFPGTGVTLRSIGGAQVNVLVDVPAYGFNPGLATIDGTARVNMGGLDTGSTVSILFSGPVAAAGFDTVNYDVDSDYAQAFVGGTLIGSFPTANQQTGFIGVRDTAGATISSIDIRKATTSSFTFNAFDNVSFGSGPPVTATPLPPTALAGLLGLAGLGLVRRVRRQVG